MKTKLQYIPYNPKDRNEWLAKRDLCQGRGLHNVFRAGGSDIGAIIGVDEYTTPLEAFYKACEYVPTTRLMKPETMRGHILEPVIYQNYYRHWDPEFPTAEQMVRNYYEGKVFRKAQRINSIILNPEHPNLFANVDYFIQKNKYTKKGVLELKSLTKYSTDKYEGGLAPTYIYQIYSYMLTTKAEYGELFALKDATYPEIYPFESNDMIFNQIITRLEEFSAKVLQVKKVKYTCSQEEYEACLHELEPPVDETPAWFDFLKEQYKKRYQEVAMQGTDQQLDLVIDYLEAKEAMKPLEANIQLKKNQIMNEFIKNECATIDFGNLGKVSYFDKFNVPASILKKYKEKDKEVA